jgi:hypothetical protein
MVDFGIGQSEVAFGDTYMPGARMTQVMASIGALNATRVRFVAPWVAIEPSRGTYFFTNLDRAVAAARDNNLIPLIVASTPKPKWYGFTATDYANMVAAIAQRYAVSGFTYNGVTYSPITTLAIEIWNEPNLSSYWPAAKPETYTEYLLAAYAAIKAVASTVTVVSAGLFGAIGTGGNFLGSTTSPVDFCQRMINAGAVGSFDAFGFHAYSRPGFQTAEPTESVITFVYEAQIRTLLNSNGASGVNIWWTEWGFPTSSVSFAVQEQYAQEQWSMYLTRLAGGGWGPCFWYDMVDTHNNPTSKESTWGLMQYDYTKKNAWFFFDTINPGTTPPGTNVVVTPAPFTVSLTGGTQGTQLAYSYTIAASTPLPSGLWTPFGNGVQVSSGAVATNNDAPHTNGTYYSGAVYTSQTHSANHYSEVTRSSHAATGTTSDMAIVRSDSTGANWVGCISHWGGANSTQILTCIGGVITSRANSTDEYTSYNEKLRLVADGNTYTVWIDGMATTCQWIDSAGAYTGAANKYPAIGFQHRYANGEYAAPGITGTWTAGDLRPT